MNHATLAALLPWCADPRHQPRMAVPRLLGSRWVATNGTAVAWCGADAPAIDLLGATPAPDCSATIAEAEACWPLDTTWHVVGVPTLPAGTIVRCPDCDGLGFIREEDAPGKPTDAVYLCPCEACDETGHQVKYLLRLECMPPARGISIDNLLRIAPLVDRFAWINNIGPRQAGALAIQTRGYRALIMPVVFDPAQDAEFVIATKAAS
jgi:hypothetical protein